MMENKNSKVLIIILTILVIGLSSFIVYDKVLNKSNIQEQDKNNTTNNNLIIDNHKSEHVELEENVKKEITELFKFVYDYYDTGNAYCGGYDNNDRIEKKENLSKAIYYTASSKYTHYDDMIKHLKTYMTERVIYGQHYMGKDNGSYVEKDGKLYCANFGKGGNIYQLTNTTITYSEPHTDVIYTQIEIELNYDGKVYEYYDVTFSKENNNWIISSFERKEQYTFSDFAGTVFKNEDNDEYLILWDNGTYSYEGTLGNYIIEGHSIKLNYIFENNKKVTQEKSIELRIMDKTQIFDHQSRKLVKVNQPPSSVDNDFYNAINNQ